MRVQGYIEGRVVYVDGEELRPEESQKVFNHSPDGFMWGYGGSGPAQLALAILMLVTDKDTAVRYHQDFKFVHVANWQDNFQIDIDVQKWLIEKS